MSLVGRRLGVYQVLSPIGAGGMGEVYRARDTVLERDVAIKVLPAAVTRDPDRLERFEREARMLAALNHPNIAQVYGFEKGDPSTSSGLALSTGSGQALSTGSGQAVNALVMELVEGPTLLERIAKGLIPLGEALNIARQLAKALEAAHERGIVHRDLKPANIKVRRDGTVKVLDFGLAKVIAGDLEPDLSHAPTLTGVATIAGVVLGTPAYMSPEQARGHPVDKRTDIWAFGCVLSEMLTGRPAFARDTVSDTIAAILERDPDGPLPPRARSVRRLLERCLEKDPKDRLRDIGDAMALVDEDASSVEATTHARRRERWLLMAAGAAVTSTVALAAWMLTRPAPAVSDPVHFTVPPPDGQRVAPGDAAAGALALSPDGRQIAFVAGPSADRSMVWLRSLDSVKARPLPGTEGAAQLFWSPDSRYLGFARAVTGGPGKLFKIAVSGGPPHELANTGPGRAAWSAQGVIIFAAPGRRQGLQRVSDAGGQPTPVTVLDESREETAHNWPLFLPDGRRFVFLAVSRTPSNNALFLASLDSPQRTHLVDAVSSTEFGSGHLLFQRDGTLMAQPFDERHGRLSGDAASLVERVMHNANSGRTAATVSSNGTLVYRTGAGGLSRLTWLDAQGRATGIAGDEGFYFDTSLSPDGRWIAVTRADQVTAPGDLWLIDVERGTPTRLTTDKADDNTPVWSSDGQHLAFRSNRNGQFDLYRRAASGAAGDELLFESAEDKSPDSFSPDGKLLLFSRFMGPERRTDMWALPLDGGAPFEILGTPYFEGHATFSPDGRWLAYDSDEQGGQVFVQSYPSNGRRLRVSTTFGMAPKWIADGKRIVYLTLDRQFMAVDLTIAGGEMRASPPREMFRHSIRRETSRLVRDYAVDSSGQRYLVAAPTDESGADSVLHVVLNWSAGLRRK